MISASRISTTPGGDPKMTITIEGFDDIYRLAHHLQHGQVEFCELGARMKRGLRRRLSPVGWEAVVQWFHGGPPVKSGK